MMETIVIVGNLKYNYKDSHFFYWNKEACKWVRMPWKWCKMNAPKDAIGLQEEITHCKRQVLKNNRKEYERIKKIYINTVKISDAMRPTSQTIMEYLLFRGHLIGMTSNDVYRDVVKSM